MSSPAPASRPRPSGGFNAGFGNFNDSFEHLDENAMQAAVKQKTLAQQATSSTQSTTGGSALGTQTPGGQAGPGGQPAGTMAQPVKPREVSTLQEELIERPTQDIVKGLTSFFDINAILGINPEADDPQTQAKKKQMLQRWNNLTDEDKQYASKKYQEELQKKKQEQQEEETRKRQAEQAKSQQLVVPSSPKKGAVGPGGSQKQQVVSKMEQDRKGLSNAKGAN